MNKNPFSIYDFMGYLFPGILILIVGAYCCESLFDFDKIINITNLKDYIDIECGRQNIERSFILIVIAYSLGHINAYLSSITIEFLTNKLFGYPSNYLLSGEHPKRRCRWGDYFISDAPNSVGRKKKAKIYLKTTLKVIICILLLPISFSIATIGRWFDINGFITRPLDMYLQRTLKDKQYKLATKLEIKHPDVNEECDYHRIVMHYVYNNITNSQKKTDNYLALYGFLRSLSLICCTLFIVLLIKSLISVFFHPWSWSLFYLNVFLYFISYLAYLGFVKFYRRYTLENLMSLLTDVNLVDNDANSSFPS